MMGSISICRSNQNKVCRLCEEQIKRKEECIMLGPIKTKGTRIDIFFHIKCVEGFQMLTESYNDEVYRKGGYDA